MDGTAQETKEEEQPAIAKSSGKTEDVNHHHSEEGMVGLLSAHIANLCSERETIWARFNIMVAVHTAILGGLAAFIHTQKPTDVEVGVAAAIGILLCILWFSIIVSPWYAYNYWEEILRELPWPSYGDKSNPFLALQKDLAKKERKFSLQDYFWSRG